MIWDEISVDIEVSCVYTKFTYLHYFIYIFHGDALRRFFFAEYLPPISAIMKSTLMK